MKKLVCICLATAICCAPSFSHAQEQNYKANAAAASSQSAVNYSMVVWGAVIFVVAFTTVFLLVKSSDS